MQKQIKCRGGHQVVTVASKKIKKAEKKENPGDANVCNFAFGAKSKRRIPKANQGPSVRQARKLSVKRKMKSPGLLQRLSITTTRSTIQSTKTWPSNFHRPSIHTSPNQ
jgi:hypothetical protein